MIIDYLVGNKFILGIILFTFPSKEQKYLVVRIFFTKKINIGYETFAIYI